MNSETDFVARNEKFQAMVAEISKLALDADGSTEKLKTMKFPGSSHDVAAYVAEMVATIGENMTVRRTASLSCQRMAWSRPTCTTRPLPAWARSACWSRSKVPATRTRSLASAACSPCTLPPPTLSPSTSTRCRKDVLARETAILEEKNAGKPANVMEKIIASGLKSYAKENCLLEQAYVHDGSKTVAQAIAEAGNKSGAALVLKGFVRMQLGEGIEKSADDFAAEVAKMSGQA